VTKAGLFSAMGEQKEHLVSGKNHMSGNKAKIKYGQKIQNVGNHSYLIATGKQV